MIIRTVCGYDFFEVSSAMQKAIRRADTGVAGFFALELWASGYRDYVWKRLFTISAEDCYGIITKEIEALWQGHELVNKTATEPKGRIFVSKAVILLCECRKNRDADHLQNFIYDRKDIDIEKWINDVRRYPFFIDLCKLIVQGKHIILKLQTVLSMEDLLESKLAVLVYR